MTVAQLKDEADLIGGITYTSKTRKADLITLIEAECARVTKAAGFTSVEERTAEVADPKEGMSAQTRVSESTPVVKPAGESNVMGLHYRGRALGAKHFQAMGLAIGRNWSESPEYAALHYNAHKPNSERVQDYARYNCQQIDRVVGYPKLTPKQMRRVRKNANKHGEHFMYEDTHRAVILSPYAGYSLLARTPEGMGIFHRFSERV